MILFYYFYRILKGMPHKDELLKLMSEDTTYISKYNVNNLRPMLYSYVVLSLSLEEIANLFSCTITRVRSSIWKYYWEQKRK